MSYWTGWGSPALIPLHFIGLDGPSYNCIRAPSPFPLSPLWLYLPPQPCPHVIPQHMWWKKPAVPLQRPTSFSIPHIFREALVDGWQHEWGELLTLLPWWWPCCFCLSHAAFFCMCNYVNWYKVAAISTYSAYLHVFQPQLAFFI